MKLTKEELLNLLNECLYAYVKTTEKKEEKEYIKNIKTIKKVLKKCYQQRIKFDYDTYTFIFK